MLNGAVPAFDLQGGLAQVLIKGLFLAGLFSALGTVAVALLATPALARLPDDSAARASRRLHILAIVSLGLAIVAGLGWLTLQAAVMSDAESLGETVAALPTVAWGTAFGHVLLMQLAAGLLGILVLWTGKAGRRRLAGAIVGLAVLLQAGHSHANAMGALLSPLMLADVIHLLSAALWLGGLVPLLLLVRDTPPRSGAVVARAFAGMGRLCVLGLIGSAIVQGWVLIGSWPGLFGTAYGWVASLKALLLIVLLGFAATNRYRLAPALLRGTPDRARVLLVRSIALQTGFAMAAVAAACVLTGLSPAMHIQAIWPFTFRLSLDAVREDPDIAREVVTAAAALSVAVILLAIAAWRRRRWTFALIAGAVVLGAWAFPHVDLLLVPAGPTDFYHSPTRFAAQSIARGLALYPEHCAACHGASGRGDGPAASRLAVPPADLTAAHLWGHSDGELFGWLTNGMDNPSGPGLVMPGFGGAISEDDRWALIDAIRARNAGGTKQRTGTWSPPIRAPDFDVLCGDGPRALGDLRGQVIRLVIGNSRPADLPGVVTILAGPAGTAHGCVSDDPAISTAYAVVSGLAPDRIAGTIFLIDANGWLREVLPEAAAPDILVSALARIRAPLPKGAGAGHMAM